MSLTSYATFRSYVLTTVLSTLLILSHALHTKKFFYRAVIHLATSKPAILALGNCALLFLLTLWRAVQALFLGPLRFREVERLHLRARDAIIECCFALTIFREEFNARFLLLVTTLLLLKSLHWLTRDRIDFLEEQPLSPPRAHARIIGLMALLGAIDARLVYTCALNTIRAPGATMLVLFAFEFAVLLIDLASNAIRYALHLVDIALDSRWDEKGLYAFYNELLSDLLQLTVYVAFFIYVQFFYTFPLHIIRDLYMTITKFHKRCTDFMRYRRVVATMNDLFADASEEELDAGDRTCIICREEMLAGKKLNCGHIFHARCLQSWLKRQLSCPTCRSPVDVSESATPPAAAPPRPAARPGPPVPAPAQNLFGLPRAPAGMPRLNNNNNNNNNNGIMGIVNTWWANFAPAAPVRAAPQPPPPPPQAFPLPHHPAQNPFRAPPRRPANPPHRQFRVQPLAHVLYQTPAGTSMPNPMPGTAPARNTHDPHNLNLAQLLAVQENLESIAHQLSSLTPTVNALRHTVGAAVLVATAPPGVPFTPGAPVAPATPVALAAPVAPVEPVTPAEPVTSTEPVVPVPPAPAASQSSDVASSSLTTAPQPPPKPTTTEAERVRQRRLAFLDRPASSTAPAPPAEGASDEPRVDGG